MKTFIALGDLAWFAGGFAACYFAVTIKAWLKARAAEALAAGKAEVAKVETDIKAKL